MGIESKINYTYCPPIDGNYTPASRTPQNGQIQYICTHWTANVSKTADALANAEYYGRHPSKFVGAHYFISNDCIAASTPENCISGSVAKWKNSVYVTECRNANSLNLELCPLSLSKTSASQITGNENDCYFEQGTLNNAIELSRYLIKKYNIPKERFIRHGDVFNYSTDPAENEKHPGYAKPCPLPFWGKQLNVYWNRTGDEAWEIYRDYVYSDNPAPIDLIKHDSPIDPSYKQWTAEVCHIADNDYLNVRTGAGVIYQNLATYPRLALNNRVDVVSETLSSDGRIWFQIRIANKYYGYVRSDYLQPLSSITIARVDHVQRLIVRSKPIVDTKTIYAPYNYLGLGNYVEVLDSSDRFFDRIRFQDQKGGYHIAYASRYYLERV